MSEAVKVPARSGASIDAYVTFIQSGLEDNDHNWSVWWQAWSEGRKAQRREDAIKMRSITKCG